MINLIFLSSLFPTQLTFQLEQNSTGNILYANNALQWNFLNGFIENNMGTSDILTAPMVGSFPTLYKKLFVKGSKFKVTEKVDGISIGYCNLLVIKNIFIEFGLKRKLHTLINTKKEKKITIIVYGMHAPYMKAALYVKKLYPQIKLCLIVPDLPEYYSNNNGIIWKLRELIQEDTYKFLPYFDSFVLLTDYMAKRLDIKNKPWVRIEGIVNPSEHLIRNEKINKTKKVIMYSGTLAARYNILDLLHAFLSIDVPNYELWICGAGDSETYIKEKAKADTRIKFFGLVSRIKVLELQREATVLVNPRNNGEEYTKYSFPSKTMEYLLSGVPVIMHKLFGIPSEYDKYIYFLNDPCIITLKDKIIEVCELDSTSLYTFGQNARNFVLEHKNYLIQSKKVLDMISKVS